MDKAAAKKEYKQAQRPMGVYKIGIAGSDKIYVGFGSDLQAKFNRHKAELKFGTHRNRELQEAWNLSGEPAFKFEVLDVLEHKEDAPANPAEELQVLFEMWVRKLGEAGYSVASL